MRARRRPRVDHVAEVQTGVIRESLGIPRVKGTMRLGLAVEVLPPVPIVIGRIVPVGVHGKPKTPYRHGGNRRPRRPIYHHLRGGVDRSADRRSCGEDAVI